MKLISYEEVQRKLGGDDGPSRRTIERMVERGEFVAPVQVSPRRVMFAEAEVDAWIETRKSNPATSCAKRNPMDYDENDVDLYIARLHGYTLEQVLGFDFPEPDYIVADRKYWAFETVTAWLERFHTAIHTIARATDPDGFERFLQSLRDLMSKKGT